MKGTKYYTAEASVEFKNFVELADYVENEEFTSIYLDCYDHDIYIMYDGANMSLEIYDDEGECIVRQDTFDPVTIIEDGFPDIFN